MISPFPTSVFRDLAICILWGVAFLVLLCCSFGWLSKKHVDREIQDPYCGRNIRKLILCVCPKSGGVRTTVIWTCVVVLVATGIHIIVGFANPTQGSPIVWRDRFILVPPASDPLTRIIFIIPDKGSNKKKYDHTLILSNWSVYKLYVDLPTLGCRLVDSNGKLVEEYARLTECAIYRWFMLSTPDIKRADEPTVRKDVQELLNLIRGIAKGAGLHDLINKLDRFRCEGPPIVLQSPYSARPAPFRVSEVLVWICIWLGGCTYFRWACRGKPAL